MDILRREMQCHGLRVTPQRVLILETIQKDRGHLDADDVYRKVIRINPRISLSTVYRTLQKFKEIGLIKELHFAEEHHHYEMKPDDEHYHLICVDCGKVIEFPYPLREFVSKNVPEASQFNITGIDATITVQCKNCYQKKSRV